ncbi:MAG: aminotransferase class I/II-fold pyridoxal phosphate-dependent enzyme [Clostridiales bacterium]|nr:aminotransferase class I/II-fold pyridoxal phosphate-dependent enzyme [Clostridiales bacterium]
MRDFLAKKIVEMPSSGIRKFFDIVTEMPDAISLGVGEPDFDTPWPIREEAIRAIKAGKTFYTANAGLSELRKAVCDYTARKIGVSYAPATECFISVGGSEAIDLAFRATLEEGDEVIIPQPCFVSYEPCVKMAGGVPVTIALKEENAFRLQPEELEAAITPRTKALFISYPNNPTGAIMEKEDLEKLVPIILEHDLLVITDEIYSELTYGGKNHFSIAALPGIKERCIYVNGFSKAFAMTGWRLGYAMAPAAIMHEMIKIHQYCIMSSPTISQYAAVYAMTDGDAETQMMRQAYDRRRKYLMRRFSDMDIPCFEPKGAFYIFPNIQEFGMTSEEFALELLQRKKVAVVPGSAFGCCGEGFLRISYAYSLDDLRVAFDRIEEFIRELRKEKA